MIPAIYSADLRRSHTKKWQAEIYSQTVTERKWDRKCVSVATSINNPSLQDLHAKNWRMTEICCFITVTLCCGLSLMDSHTAWSLFVRVSFKHAVIQTIDRHSRRGPALSNWRDTWESRFFLFLAGQGSVGLNLGRIERGKINFVIRGSRISPAMRKLWRTHFDENTPA